MEADISTTGDAEEKFQADLLKLKVEGRFNNVEFLADRPPEEAFFLDCECRSIGIPVHLTLPAIRSDIAGGDGCLATLEQAWKSVSECSEKWHQACSGLAQHFHGKVKDAIADSDVMPPDKEMDVINEVDFIKIEQKHFRARREYYERLLSPGALPAGHPYVSDISKRNCDLRLLEAAHSGEIKPVTLNTISDVVPFSNEDPAFLVLLSRHSENIDPNVAQNLLSESAIAELRYVGGILNQKNIGPKELDRLKNDDSQQHIIIARLEDCVIEVGNLAKSNDDLSVIRNELRQKAHFVEWCMSNAKYPLYNALPRLIDALYNAYTKFTGNPDAGEFIESEDMKHMSDLAIIQSEVPRFEEE